MSRARVVRPSSDRDSDRPGSRRQPGECRARSNYYRPDSRARLLRSSRSRLIGVVFGVQHAFHGDLVSGLYAAAKSADYELALSAVTPSRDEREAIASVLQDRCEALILLGPQVPTAYLADLATRMPVSSSRAHPAPGGGRRAYR